MIDGADPLSSLPDALLARVSSRRDSKQPAPELPVKSVSPSASRAVTQGLPPFSSSFVQTVRLPQRTRAVALFRDTVEKPLQSAVPQHQIAAALADRGACAGRAAEAWSRTLCHRDVAWQRLFADDFSREVEQPDSLSRFGLGTHLLRHFLRH